MKMLMLCVATLVALGSSAAVAKVSEVRHEVRPVYNSGTGVMPDGAQESMPVAARRLKRKERLGVGFSPVQFGFFTPLQWPNEDFDIGGLRLDIYGTCCNFDGLDLGFVGVMKNHANGILLNVLATYAEGDGIGLSVGCANVFGGDFIGMQLGLGNWIDSGSVFQLGLLNRGYDIKGLQIGVVNTATHMEGVQIGLINVISCSDRSFFPIVNMYY